jgi:hypothetical protein
MEQLQVQRAPPLQRPAAFRRAHAREQQLWNAAANDEVNMGNVGRPHSYDFVHKPFHRGKFLQQRRLEREIATGKHHIISNPRDTEDIFQPLKWMHEQGEPQAVSRRSGLRPSSAV